jgi:hypothetical protein
MFRLVCKLDNNAFVVLLLASLPLVILERRGRQDLGYEAPITKTNGTVSSRHLKLMLPRI